MIGFSHLEYINISYGNQFTVIPMSRRAFMMTSGGFELKQNVTPLINSPLIYVPTNCI